MELYDDPDNILFTTPIPSLVEIGISRDANILELGCGYGRMLGQFYVQGYNNLTGIDFSERLIERAKKILPQAHYYNANIVSFDTVADLPCFDLILICGVLEYIVSDEEREALLKRIRMHLSVNGKVHVESFLINQEPVLAEGKYGKYSVVNLRQGFQVRHDYQSGIDDIFIQNGFRKEWGENRNFVTWHEKEVPGYICEYTIQKNG